MATNLDLDDKLVSEAVRLGHKRSKKDAVNDALREYVQRRKQLKLLKSFGTVDFDPEYDHKVGRSRS